MKCVKELIGPDTTSTAPIKTLDAYHNHADPMVRIAKDVDGACRILKQFPELGIDLDQVTQQLEDEGDKTLAESFDNLIEALEKVLHMHSGGK